MSQETTPLPNQNLPSPNQATPEKIEPTPAKPTPPTTGNSSKSLSLFIMMLVVVAGLSITYAVFSRNDSNKKATNTAAVTPEPAAVGITSTGFEPANIQAKVGTTITWTNNDTKPHRVASDPYPSNNNLAGFDSQDALQPQDTYSFTFEKAGTFTYHDDLNPLTIKGTIVVTE